MSIITFDICHSSIGCSFSSFRIIKSITRYFDFFLFIFVYITVCSNLNKLSASHSIRSKSLKNKVDFRLYNKRKKSQIRFCLHLYFFDFRFLLVSFVLRINNLLIFENKLTYIYIY